MPKRRFRFSITRKFCFVGCAGRTQAFGGGFAAFDAALDDCGGWRCVLGFVDMVAGLATAVTKTFRSRGAGVRLEGSVCSGRRNSVSAKTTAADAVAQRRCKMASQEIREATTRQSALQSASRSAVVDRMFPILQSVISDLRKVSIFRRRAKR